MTSDDEKHTEFMRIVSAGMEYARQRWSNADEGLVLKDAFELGSALDAQGLDGANHKAAELEAERQGLRRI
jgi:hypothetical protein